MKRRTLLRWLGTGAASWPLLRVRLRAANELSPSELLLLRDVAQTVLPSELGAKGTEDAVNEFARWLRDYREGVPLSHGYGVPRLVRTGASPVARYSSQLAALQEAARARGGRFGTLSLEQRRALLDEAFKQSDVRNLPGRPDGKHVVSDLMAHYFRSSAATDLCYNAHIGRNTSRTIQITTVRPAPLNPR
ncbi:MAG: hypothetical protein ACRD2N_06820 [Vicinamibacterales bacterium]